MKSTQTKYKTTNIPWLPTVPQDWDLVKTKFLFNERVQKGFDAEPLLAATQSQGVIPKSLYETNTVTAQKDFHLLKLVTVGDFVISLRSFQGGIEYAYYRGIISPAYTVFFSKNTEEINPQFFRYFFKSEPFVKSLTLFVTGIREGQNIDYNEFKNSLLPLPPIDEQNAIANYLDGQSEKINLFIANKQKLMGLMKLQRQAIINKAVTKGLDENVKLQSSGIDFIKEVPVNWEIRKLKFLLIEKNIRSESGDEELLALSKYKGVIPKRELEDRLGGAESLIGYKKVTVDDLVVNKMQAANGLIAVSKVTGITSPEYSVYRVKSNELLIDYYGYLLSQPQYLAIYKAYAKGVMEGYIRLYTEDLFDIRALVPPLNEQMEIVEYIKEETAKIDEVIIRTEKEIELIKEYRQSIIAEVVTGKIKVAN